MKVVPRISVAMPTFNSARYLAASVESVIAQTRPDWELVLCDDGSRDGTVEAAEDLARRDDRIRCCRAITPGRP